MIKILVLLILSFGITDSALSQTHFQCKNYSNQLVLFIPVSTSFLLNNGSVFARSTRTRFNYPIILIDISKLKNTPMVFQQFVIAHECAHHELGHISEYYQNVPSHIEMNIEKDADCKAIRTLIEKHHFTKSDIEELANFVEHDDVYIHKMIQSITHSNIPLQPTKFQRSSKQRSYDIKNCSALY